ncbi:MAG: hypothetical protein IJ404_05605 [Clostridia bacterium]|nr:hypothetical protein [Clostridia bacterium]
MYRKYRSRKNGIPKENKEQTIVAAEDKLAEEYDERMEENEVTKKGFFSSFFDFDKRVFRSRDMRLSFFYGSLITLCAISLGQLLAKLI